MRFDLQLDPGRVPDGPGRDARTTVPGPPLPVLQAAVGDGGGPVCTGVSSPVTWYELAPEDRTRLLYVPPGTRIVGDVEAPAVWVAGEVTGRVRATHGALVVAESGRVGGGVVGHGPVVVAGQVFARAARAAVLAHGRLDLAGTARVTGEVLHGVVAVYEGAQVTGGLRASGIRPPRR